MIVMATVIWGFSFVVMKDAVEVMGQAYLLGFRFLFTAVLLSAVFFKHFKKMFKRDTLVAGGVLGLLNFLAFWTQTVGITYTTPGKNAFLTATYCVLVPFAFWLVARRKPTAFNLVAAVLCVAGVGMVSLNADSSGIGFGDLMTLVCAVFFAIHIVFVSLFSEKHDVLSLTIMQFWVGGVCGLALGACIEPAPAIASITPEFVFNMFYLVVFASCIALVFQNVALAHVPPAQGSLLLSLESVFGVLFSVLLYGEQVTVQLLVGFALIFCAIIVSEVLPERFGKKNKQERLAHERETERAG